MTCRHAVLLFAFMAANAHFARAGIINVATTGAPPDSMTVDPAATLVASTSGTFVSGTFTADYVENVYSDPSNQFGPGDLDWIVWLKNTGAVGDANAIIEHVTVSSFAGVLTDVGVNTNGAPGMSNTGTVQPYTVDRSGGTGSVLTWDFTGPGGANESMPGTSTVLLEVMTSAKAVAPGFLSGIDGGSAQASAYGVAVPEPGTGLLLLGAVGSAMFRRRQSAH